MAYLSKMDPCNSNWIADYRKIRLLSSSEQFHRLKTFRKDDLTKGVEMEYTKPQATCRWGTLEREILFLLWIRKKEGFDPLWSVMLPHTPSLGVVLQWSDLWLDRFQERRWPPFYKQAKWRTGLYFLAQDQNCRSIPQAGQIQQ